MREINRHKNINRVLATVMSFIMVVSLLSGIGVLFTKPTRVEADEQVLNYGNNTFSVSDDDFMVLEIVPDASMAQFGYLVSGQEPINLAAMTEEQRAQFYTSYENESAGIIEFQNKYKDTVEDWEDYIWMGLSQDMQYGEYVPVAAGTGNYTPVLEGASYTKVPSTEKTTGEYAYYRYDPRTGTYTEKLNWDLSPNDITADTIYIGVDKFGQTAGQGDYSWSTTTTVNVQKTWSGEGYLPYFQDFTYNGADNADKKKYLGKRSGCGDKEITNDFVVIFEHLSGTELQNARNNGEVLYSPLSNPAPTTNNNKYNRVSRRDVYKYYSYDGSVYTYHNTPSTSYYYVHFGVDPNGEYRANRLRTWNDGENDSYYNRGINYIVADLSYNYNEDQTTVVNHTTPQYVVDSTSGTTRIKGSKDCYRYDLIRVDRAAGQTGEYNYTRNYSMSPATSGDYVFEGMTVEECDALTASQKTQYTGKFTTVNKTYGDLAVDERPTVKGSMLQSKSEAFVKFTVNEDKFKKYTLGLAYIDNDIANGQDVDYYQFRGWYYEPECINIYNEGDPITDNITLYADWLQQYGDGTTAPTYRVTFDDGVDDAHASEVLNMPFTTYPEGNKFSLNAIDILAGAKIVSPFAQPTREGYVFTGWYDSAANKVELDEGITVNSDITLYAGWREIKTDGTDYYTIEFSSNLPVGETVFSTGLDNMPPTITGTAVELATVSGSGLYMRNGQRIEMALPTNVPTRTDKYEEEHAYKFAGWYLDRECTVEFNLGDPVEYEFENNRIILYARWVIEDVTSYTVTFNTNKPLNANNDIEADTVQAPVTVIYGETMSLEDKLKPELKGNVAAKLGTYNVKVVTVTPNDLSKFTLNRADSRRNGESLIKRADFIVINESASDSLRQTWASCRNQILFPNELDYYGTSFNSGTGKYSFAKDSFSGSKGIDLTWNQTLELMKKIAGADRYTPCPIIYDYAIYKNIMANGNSASVTMAEQFANGGAFGISGVTSYSNNLYKFYLFSSQANPITLYNAFFIKSPHRIDASNGNILAVGSSTDSFYTEGKRGYWNEYSMVPFSVIDKDEWNSDKDAALATVGFKIGVSLDTAHDDCNAINGRFYVYGYESSVLGSSNDIVNVVDGYITPSFNTLVNEGGGEVKEGLGADGAYKPAEIGYYMLKMSVGYENFTTDINILEIEPCDTYRTDDFWFWYISRCIPNYLGSPHVTGMTSSEFNGSVEELASRYDIIYFGVNDQTLNRDILFNNDDYSEKTGATPKKWWKYIIDIGGGSEVSEPEVVKVTQAISVQYEKLVKNSTITNFTTSSSENAAHPNYFASVTEPFYLVNGVPVLNREKLGIYADWFGLSIENDKAFTIFSTTIWERGYRYKNTSGEWVYLDATKMTGNGGITIELERQNGNTSYGTQNFQYGLNRLILSDEWDNIIFKTKPFYWGTETATVGDEWITCAPGTIAYAGDTIRFRDMSEPYELLTRNYVYTHVGPSVLYEDNSAWSKLLQWFTNSRSINYSDYLTLLGCLGTPSLRSGYSNSYTNSDTVAEYLFAGNDITLDKYNELIEYASVGHPIVFARDVVDHTGATAKINDKMIDSSSNIYKLINELYTTHVDSCFETFDSSKDAQLAATIQKYAFSLDVQGPEEYGGDEDSYLDSSIMEFTVRINTNSRVDSNYSVALYVDTNSDGKYSPADEIIESPTVVDMSTGNQVTETRLRAGIMYKITADIGDYEYGIAPWQLVVTNLTTRKQTGATGKAGIKGSDEKETLYILQIVPDSGATVVLPTVEDIKNSSFTGANESKLYTLTKDLRDYEFAVFRKTVSNMKSLLSTNPADFTVGKDKDGNDVYFSQIYIIVLGCGQYFEIKDTNTLNRLQTFIASGKPVIFTYDTVSYVNYAPETPDYDINFNFDILWINFSVRVVSYRWDESKFKFWGYAQNQAFREALGMDRFDVLTNKGDFSIATNKAADLPYKLNKTQAKTTENIYVTKNKVLAQGYSNTTVAMHYDLAKDKGTGSNSYVVPINEGQITSYPYVINSDGINVGATHASYYQLDFEGDDTTVWYCLTSDRNSASSATHTSSSDEFYYGADARNNYYLYNHGNITYMGIGKTSSVTDDELKLFVNTIIAASRTGVRPTVPVIVNNDKASVRKNLEYLYIDYDATVNKSVTLGAIQVQSEPFGAGIGTAKDVDFDGDGTVDAAAVYYKRVYFTLKDYSIIRNKKMIVEYQPVAINTDGTITKVGATALGLTTYMCDEDGTPLKDGSGDVLTSPVYEFKYKVDASTTSTYGGTIVETGGYYYVDIPISDAFYDYYLGDDVFNALDGSDKFAIRLEVITRFGDINDDGPDQEFAINPPLLGTQDVAIMRRGMFTLD